jgi:hypothetical protein
MATATPWEHYADATLTAESFPAFYTRLMGLRFPIPVEDVLELRDLLNHSADRYDEPADTPQYREFRDSLEHAIYSFGVEDKRHCQRLLTILSLFRDLHYQHTVQSRNSETRLREARTENRVARARSLRYGVIALFAMSIAGLVWFGMSEPIWQVKALTAVLAFFSLDYFRSLPTLDRDFERLGRQLNELMRRRVDTLNWKTLIHKIALILGYKRIEGIEVFHRNHTTETEYPTQPPQYH